MDTYGSDLEERTSSLAEDAIVAELAETIDLQASRLASLNHELEDLRAERSRLTNELHTARTWIRELAAELQRAEPPRS
jgi:predicted  nucleic acid-binding Zn-ribbon protein